ncbi:MAG: hypothetical protein ABI425_04945 [Patescibacteria group bacterium]
MPLGSENLPDNLPADTPEIGVTGLDMLLKGKYGTLKEGKINDKAPPFDDKTLHEVSIAVVAAAEKCSPKESDDDFRHDVKLAAEKIVDVMGCRVRVNADGFKTKYGILVLGRAYEIIYNEAAYFQDTALLSPEQLFPGGTMLLKDPLFSFYRNEVRTAYERAQGAQ